MVGFIQVYTGDGKGKTSAAVGLTIRAVGAGLKVAFFQFLKGGFSSEIKILKSFPSIWYQNYGFSEISVKVTPELREILKRGWEDFKRLLFSGEYNIIVLDELTYILNWGVIEKEEWIEVFKQKPREVEIVITGRDAPKELIEIADLVTEMKNIKHYYEKGVQARKGIEW